MTVTKAVWKKYIDALNNINRRAGIAMQRWIDAHGVTDLQAMTEEAYRLASAYGAGAAALSAEMYDAMAELEGAELPPAEAAETASWQETSDAIYGIAKTSLNAAMYVGAVMRLVKLAGADTTMKNAIRDRAQVAWIPSGDTCAFCLAIAAEGWKTATADALKGGHAEHIHGHCDCEYAVRHDKDTAYPGYDPKEYREIVQDSSLDGEAPSAQNRINAMRREFYAENRERINAQKRDAYQKRRELESSAAEEKNV